MHGLPQLFDANAKQVLIEYGRAIDSGATELAKRIYDANPDLKARFDAILRRLDRA